MSAIRAPKRNVRAMDATVVVFCDDAQDSMRNPEQITSAVLVSLLLTACAGTTPVTHEPRIRSTMGALALLPADSMFVARVDLALLRATTAFEAMAALPGAPQEALAAFLAIDQVYVSVGPMVDRKSVV